MSLAASASVGEQDNYIASLVEQELCERAAASAEISGRPRGIIYYSGRLDAARECLASSHEAYSPERLISAQAAAFVGTADSTWTSLVAHQRFARGQNCSTSFEQLLSRHWRERCNPNMPQGLVARELLARGVESFRLRCV